jgi:Tol biopolymer transport system component
MISDAATSPDGRTLVFHAIGSLWRMQLPNGTPQRLTSDEHFEYAPSFSPDGRSIVYTTWSDTDLGAIYRIDLDGRNKRKLTERQGLFFHASLLCRTAGRSSTAAAQGITCSARSMASIPAYT